MGRVSLVILNEGVVTEIMMKKDIFDTNLLSLSRLVLFVEKAQYHREHGSFQRSVCSFVIDAVCCSHCPFSTDQSSTAFAGIQGVLMIPEIFDNKLSNPRVFVLIVYHSPSYDPACHGWLSALAGHIVALNGRFW